MSTLPRRLTAHLTYANLVSTTALVVALGAGTAYAANTVFSSDIVDGDVQHADLNATAVEGDRIVDGSIGHADLGPLAIAGDQIVDGTVGHADLGAQAVAGDRVADGSLTLLDLSGVDVSTTVSVPKLRPGKCRTVTIGVTGARPGQLTAVSATDKLKTGLVLSAQRVPANDQLEVGACNVGTKNAKASAVRVRVVTFD